jgi:hypothetical protein
VAAALTRPGLPRSVPVYDTVDQALAPQARSRPPFPRERLGLVKTLDAFTTAGWFVGPVCRRWQLEELAETARWLAGELAIDAVFAQRSNLEAVELRAGGLLIAVHSGAPDPAVTHTDHQGEPGSGLKLAQRLAQRWAVRWQADGSRMLCVSWGTPAPNAPERCMPP